MTVKLYKIDSKNKLKQSNMSILDHEINIDEFVRNLLTYGFNQYEARFGSGIIIAFKEDPIKTSDVYDSAKVELLNRTGVDINYYKMKGDKLERKNGKRLVAGKVNNGTSFGTMQKDKLKSIYAAKWEEGNSRFTFKTYIKGNYNAWINNILFSQSDTHYYDGVPILYSPAGGAKANLEPANYDGNSSDSNSADLSKFSTPGEVVVIETMVIRGMSRLIQNTLDAKSGTKIGNGNRLLGTVIYDRIIDIVENVMNKLKKSIGMKASINLENNLIPLIESNNKESYFSEILDDTSKLKKIISKKLRSYDSSISPESLKKIIESIDYDEASWFELRGVIFSHTSSRDNYMYDSNIIGLNKFIDALQKTSDFSETLTGDDVAIRDSDIEVKGAPSYNIADIKAVISNAQKKGFVEPGVGYAISFEFKDADDKVPKVRTSGGKIINNAGMSRMMRSRYKRDDFFGTGRKNKVVVKFTLPKSITTTNENFYKEFAEILKKSVSNSL